MKFITTTSALVAACALAASTVAAAGAQGAPWGYAPTDTARGPSRAGPAEWGEYYTNCAGTSQSPIDIVAADTKQKSKLQNTLRFRGECGSFNLTQGGEGFKAAVVDGTQIKVVELTQYVLTVFDSCRFLPSESKQSQV
ncbi:hypothetical protein DVH05_010495 [Phytophthora capsici]|nr:hypothetical protein DVH05_010495 [Phytophthora capsici]